MLSPHERQETNEHDMFCELHQTFDHDTGGCEVLKAQACKMRADWETHWNKQPQNSQHKNEMAKTCA